MHSTIASVSTVPANSLNGRYITAEDVGIDVNDMEWVFRETEFM